MKNKGGYKNFSSTDFTQENTRVVLFTDFLV